MTFPVLISAFLFLSVETINSGDSITITSSATGGAGSYTYGVYHKKTSAGSWTTKQNFSATSTLSLKLTDKTTYDICVVKDSKGTIAKQYFTVTVK